MESKMTRWDKSKKPTPYVALLRLWGESADWEGTICWRASLEELQGQRYGFADMEALFAFLMQQTINAPLDPHQETDQMEHSPPSTRPQ